MLDPVFIAFGVEHAHGVLCGRAEYLMRGGDGGAVCIKRRMFASKELALARAFLDLVDNGIQAFTGDTRAIVPTLELWVGFALEATLQRGADGAKARVVLSKNRDSL